MIVSILIFIISLGVYAGYGIPGLIYILGATALSYALGLVIPKRRWLLWPGVAVNAAWLLLVKLQPVTGLGVLAPLGVSYFTLRLIAYMADIYRGKYLPEKNFFRYALFVTYLPSLFLGPIQSYDTMGKALTDRKVSWDGISHGAARMLWGGFKKLVIASRVGVLVSAISADPSKYNGAWALCAMILYSVQLYCDFSGGIDMVLGGSSILGIRLQENFNAPYLSESFQEFWRRWHMTLGSWLREYVYIPLGGNRKGKVRKVANLLVTFLVSGIWHGIEYLLWGVINGIFVAFGRALQTKCKTLNRIATFLLVSLLWSFFVWPDALTAGKMVLSVFTTFNYGDFLANIGAMGLSLGDLIVLLVAVAMVAAYDCNMDAFRGWFAARKPWVRVAVSCVLALLVLVFGMYGIGFNAGAFIYSRF